MLLLIATLVQSAAMRLRVSSPRMAASASSASVLFVVPQADSVASPFGATSPEPNPSWLAVAKQLAERLPGFDERLSSTVVTEDDLLPFNELDRSYEADVVVALGLKGSTASQIAPPLGSIAEEASALVSYDCGAEITALTRVGKYSPAGGALQDLQAKLAPWDKVARGKRLCDQADLLLSRHSSEDLLYAIFFLVHEYACELDIVRYTVNPTWEKGPIRNAQEFASMCTKCGDKIATALTDPETKATIDLLNACDMRDQVGSYRVIVSYETPQLEDFSLCILQQNNCFGCDAKIIETPRVPLMQSWRGETLDARAARQLFIGHFKCDEAHPSAAQGLPWSWKIVCGANPAYDAFPAQHQIFYPSAKSENALWYDPVFKVETLDGRQVWTKRHYRCSPRKVAEDLAGPSGESHGAWTLSTLDNGVISKEHWTTVDAADDLSWAVFHYSGAAAVVGQSYLGALLCSADGQWPESARSGPEFERIRSAFRKCAIEMFELYGHGPAEEGKSFMWTAEHQAWEANNPPPLEPIGDQSVQAWRASEKQKIAAS